MLFRSTSLSLTAAACFVLGALMLTCFVTNPDKAKHAAAVKDKVVAQEPTAVGRISSPAARSPARDGKVGPSQLRPARLRGPWIEAAVKSGNVNHKTMHDSS